MTWACGAYGPEGREVGALCFRSPELHQRVCGDVDECAAFMAAERRRVFSRINELAAAGDPVAELLAQEFTSPDELLDGDA